MRNTGRYHVCPYYMSSSRYTITCEDIQRTYADPVCDYEEVYCKDDWESCVIARRLNELWERILNMTDESKKNMEMINHTIREQEDEIASLKATIKTLRRDVKAKDKEMDELRGKVKMTLKDISRAASEMPETGVDPAEVTAKINRIAGYYESILAYVLSTRSLGYLDMDGYYKWIESKQYRLKAVKRDKDGQPTAFQVEIKDLG